MGRTKLEAPKAQRLHRTNEAPVEAKDRGSDLTVGSPLARINSALFVRASGGKSSTIHRSLLKMQRVHGNGYVQRAVAQARAVMRQALRRKKGEVTFSKEEVSDITVSKNRVTDLKNKRFVAEQGVMTYVKDFAQKAVAEGMDLGFDSFADWYNQYEKAKELAEESSIPGIVFSVLTIGVKAAFPEFEIFGKVMSEASAKIVNEGLKATAEMGVEKLEKASERKREDVAPFLAHLKVAEARARVALLDAPQQFRKKYPDVLNNAIAQFAQALDAGWESSTELPKSVKATLAAAGIEEPGSDTAKEYAHHWLAAHIETIYKEVPANELMNAPTKTLAEISALRFEDKVGNRERVFALEQTLGWFWHSMVDLNAVDAEYMHVKLDIDRDKAEEIIKSRHTTGKFGNTKALVNRGLLSEQEYGRIAYLVVAHH